MKILLASKICPVAVERLSLQHTVRIAWDVDQDSLQKLVKDCEVIVFRSGVRITKEIMASAPQLKLLIRAGSGLDNLDLEYVQKRGIVLYHIPGPGARAVAELAIALMLTLARSTFYADIEIRKGNWRKHEIDGYLIQHKTLGIVGAGNIGTTLGELAVAMGMDVIACVANPNRERAQSLAKRGIELTDFEAVLRQSDFLSLHVPLLETTRKMVGEYELQRMKQSSYLINLARGGVVDEEALYRELTERQTLAGAALDVHEKEGDGHISPLAGLKNVVLTPHIGATTLDTQHEIGRRILELVAAADDKS